jgi:hypothetical protein
MLVFMCFAGGYMAILELALDHWRLQNPEASEAELFRRRAPWVLVLVAAVPILFLFVR